MKDKELAVALGISGAMVSKHKAKGMPTDSVESALRWRAAYLQPARVKGVRADTATASNAGTATAATETPSGAPSYMASRARREAAEAAIAENKLREQTGELVRTEDVRRAMGMKVAALSQALFQIPPRLTPVLVAETSAERIHALLQEELTAAMVLVTQGPARDA
jgi:hypothetical protein